MLVCLAAPSAFQPTSNVPASFPDISTGDAASFTDLCLHPSMTRKKGDSSLMSGASGEDLACRSQPECEFAGQYSESFWPFLWLTHRVLLLLRYLCFLCVEKLQVLSNVIPSPTLHVLCAGTLVSPPQNRANGFLHVFYKGQGDEEWMLLDHIRSIQFGRSERTYAPKDEPAGTTRTPSVVLTTAKQLPDPAQMLSTSQLRRAAEVSYVRANFLWRATERERETVRGGPLGGASLVQQDLLAQHEIIVMNISYSPCGHRWHSRPTNPKPGCGLRARLPPPNQSAHSIEPFQSLANTILGHDEILFAQTHACHALYLRAQFTDEQVSSCLT